jgi:hypothetical protein
MLQYVIVVAVVVGIVFIAGRSVWSSLASKNTGCGCGSSAGCGSAGSCKTRAAKLSTIQKATPATNTPHNL